MDTKSRGSSRPKWKISESDQKLLIFCLVSTFVWGLAAHGDGLLSGTFSHDSLAEFDAAIFGNIWQIQLGRVLIPVYRSIFRTAVTMPWLIGLLGMLWSGLALYLIAHIFRLQQYRLTLVLIGGVLMTNVSVTILAANYSAFFDQDLFAGLLAVLAVFLWQRARRWDLLLGALCVGVMLGIYQSYVSVTITLILMVLVLALLNGEAFGSIFKRGLLSLGMLAMGAVVYLLELPIGMLLTGQEISTRRNSVMMAFQLGGSAMDFVKQIVETAVLSCKTMVCMPTVYTAFSGVTVFYLGRLFRIASLLIVAGALLVGLLDCKLGIKEKILVVLLAGVMPIGMNVAHILAHGVSHALMYYALWLIQPFALLLGLWLLHRYGAGMKRGLHTLVRLVPVLVLAVIVWDNVQVANMASLDMRMRIEATNMLYTRVLTRMEEVPGYEPGVTPVVILGRGDRQLTMPRSFEPIRNMTMQGVPVITVDSPQFLAPYFETVLQTPVALDTEHWEKLQRSPTMQKMPCYPEQGSVQLVDGTLLVKLGSLEEATEG